MSTFATRIKELRVSKGLTQSEMAKVLGNTKQTISLWERGLRRAETDTVQEIAKYFNVNAGYVLGITDDAVPQPENVPIDSLVLNEQQQLLEMTDVCSLYCQLSKANQRIILAAVKEAYRVDCIQGTLKQRDAYTVNITSKWLKENTPAVS